jgi:hypothetical protein
LQKETVLTGEFDPVLLGGRQGGWRAKITTFEAPPRPAPGGEILERVELEIWWQNGPDRRRFNLEAFRSNIVRPEDMPPPPGAPQ